MNKEQTLVLIKPDGVQRNLIGKIITRFEDAGLKIIGALNKVDLKPAGMEELQIELAELIGVNSQEIHQVSGSFSYNYPMSLKICL